MTKAILRDFPDNFETERLLIRVPRVDDGVALQAAVVESLPALRPWMPWAMEMPTVEQEEAVAREAYAKFLARTDMMLLLFHKASKMLVGGSGLHRIDWDVPSCEIGYWARSQFAGQGYITEAVNGITAFAFDVVGARRVEIRCNEENTRSAAVARRAGFVLEGVLHNHRRHHLSNELNNTMVFAKVRGDTDDGQQ